MLCLVFKKLQKINHLKKIKFSNFNLKKKLNFKVYLSAYYQYTLPKIYQVVPMFIIIFSSIATSILLFLKISYDYFFAFVINIIYVFTKGFINFKWLIPIKRKIKSRGSHKIMNFILTGRTKQIFTIHEYTVDLFNGIHAICSTSLCWFFFQFFFLSKIAVLHPLKSQIRLNHFNNKLYCSYMSFYGTGIILFFNKKLYKNIKQFKKNKNKSYKLLVLVNWFITQDFCYYFLKKNTFTKGFFSILREIKQLKMFLNNANAIVSTSLLKFRKINGVLMIFYIMQSLILNHRKKQKKVILFSVRTKRFPLIRELYRRFKAFISINVNARNTRKILNFFFRLHFSRLFFFFKFFFFIIFYWLIKYNKKDGRNRIRTYA